MKKEIAKGNVALTLRGWLLRHYGTDDRQMLRDEYRVGAKVVDGQTMELVEFVHPGYTSNRWLFGDLVRSMNDYLMESSHELRAELRSYFVIRVYHKVTEVRVRVSLGRMGVGDD